MKARFVNLESSAQDAGSPEGDTTTQNAHGLLSGVQKQIEPDQSSGVKAPSFLPEAVIVNNCATTYGETLMMNIKQGSEARDKSSNKFVEEVEAMPPGLARQGTTPLEGRNVIEVNRAEESIQHDEEVASSQQHFKSMNRSGAQAWFGFEVNEQVNDARGPRSGGLELGAVDPYTPRSTQSNNKRA